MKPGFIVIISVLLTPAVISESNDLSARHSDVVKRLRSDWQAWSRRVVINKPQFLLRPPGHH